MIALPGLCLTTGRYRRRRARSWPRSPGAVHDGLLPNRFSDSGGGAEYNTVDASLWFFHAVHAYAQASGDWDFATGEMLPVLQDILAHHIAGTDYGISVDPPTACSPPAQPGVQLTWMDAKVGDWVVTPRIGKPVEINALWHNALCVTADLAHRAGQADGRRLRDAAPPRPKPRSPRPSANPATHSLFDVIGPDGRPDASLRPNQIFAVSLPFPVDRGRPGEGRRGPGRRNLLTPFGLRTLAPGSPDYHAHYGPGDQRRATARTIRARSGPGCSARSSTPT